jgi:hypothetical protein
MATRELAVRITGDPKSLSRAFKQADRDASRFGKSMGRVGGHLKTLGKVGATAAVAVAGAFAGIGLKEAIEAEKVMAQTNATLKSTGGAAKVSAKEIANLAAAIQKKSGLDAEAIQSGQNLLLTFTNVRNEAGKGNDIFSQATGIMSDMSVALGTDMKGSAIQLGKALNDPIKGVSALSRVGVSFTAQQKEQIKTLVDSGKTLDAQKIILAELNKEFGGSAAAFGNTTAGQVEKAKRSFEDLSSSIMAQVLPVINRLLTFVNTKVIPAIASFAASIKRHWPQIREITLQVWTRVREIVANVISWFQANVVPTVRSIVNRVTKFWNEHKEDISRIFNLIRRTIERVLKIVRAVIEGVLALIRGDWSKAWNSLKTIVSNVLGGIVDIIKSLGPVLGRAALSIGKTIGKAIKDGIVGAIKGIGRGISNAVKAGVNAGIDLINALIGKFNSVFSFSWDPPGPGSISVDAPDIPKIGHLNRGGRTSGPYRGYDDRLVALAGNEAVLTPKQQSMIPGGRRTLDAIFRLTGARSFASGGYTNPFPGGSWSGSPSAHRARALGDWQSDNAWDIMGSGDVYAVLPGTIGRVSGMDMRPQFAGQGVYLETSDGTWWYKHIKASVSSGQKVKAGDVIGSTAPITWVNGGPHLHLATSSGDPARARGGAAPGRGGSSTAGNQPSQGEPKLTPRQKLAKLFGGGKVGAGIAGKLLGARTDVSEGVSGRLVTDTPAGQRGIAKAGRAAYRKARDEGKSPEEAADAQKNAERKRQIELLQGDIKKVNKAMKKLDIAWNGFRKRLNAKKPKATPKQRKALVAAMKANRREKDDLLELKAELEQAIKDIGFDAEVEAYSDAYGDGGEAVEPPTEGDFLDAEAAKAALTPGLDDDLAAAQAIEAKAQRDYDAALASNDPRRIAETAGALLSARQNREQIQATIANTEALNQNTEAMKGMSGSSVFGYRGQDYALRSIGLPSSDTLVGMETGI